LPVGEKTIGKSGGQSSRKKNLRGGDEREGRKSLKIDREGLVIGTAGGGKESYSGQRSNSILQMRGLTREGEGDFTKKELSAERVFSSFMLLRRSLVKKEGCDSFL